MKVFILAVLSADGLMGAHNRRSSLDWRSKEDGELFSKLTREAGIMVLGSATYQTFRIKRAPPGRRLLVYTHHPENVVGDGVEAIAEDPKLLIDKLAQEGYPALAVCGGAEINTLFLNAGVVDELYLTVEPVVFGSGIPLFRGTDVVKLQLLDEAHLNPNTLLLHYAILK